MRRMFLVGALVTILVSTFAPIDAQQTKRIPRIGFLSLAPPGPRATHEAFRQGLRKLGYVEGDNIVIEYRAADGKTDRLRTLAHELVDLKTDLIVAAGSQAVRAAQQATSSIPIIMTSSSDPVGTGFVASLARPRGNITWLSLLSPDLSTKRLELLKEVVVRLSRVAVLWNPDDPPAKISLNETIAAAKALGMQIEALEARNPGNFENAFRSAIKARVHAIVIIPAPIMNTHAKQIGELAVKNGLPSISYARDYSEAGGLMSYGANLADLYKRAATYVDKILKGTKPADLPVEQPKKFEFVINLKAAKQMGLTIPPNVLARADRVIR